MGDFQNIATIILALVVGFIIGRSSKKITIRRDPERLTPEEWASLQPKGDHIPIETPMMMCIRMCSMH